MEKLVHNNAHEVNQETTPAAAPFTSCLIETSLIHTHTHTHISAAHKATLEFA